MPPGSRKSVRKIEPAPRADFDDQSWLINCALLILAGSIVGVVAAVSDFDDPRLLYNGYVRLGLVGLIVLALFAAIRWLEGRVLRRVQFCILVSLLVHFWIDVYLISSYLEARAEMENRRREAVEDPADRLTTPDYHITDERPSEFQSTYDEPTSTPTPPKPETEPLIQRVVEQDLPFQSRKPVEERSPPVSQPNPAELKRHDLTAPRRDIAGGGQISRQPRQLQTEVGAPIPQPPIHVQQPVRRAEPAPSVAASAGKVQQPISPVRHEMQSPSPEAAVQPPAAARRIEQVRLDPATTAASASPNRALTTAEMPPTPPAERVEPARVSSAERASPSPPAAAMAARSAASLPQPRLSLPAPNEPTSNRTEASPVTAGRRQERPVEQESSALPASAAVRQMASVAVAGTAEAASAGQPSSNLSETAPVVRPREAEVSRQSASSAAVANSAPTPPIVADASVPQRPSLPVRRSAAAQSGAAAVADSASSSIRRRSDMPVVPSAISAADSVSPTAAVGQVAASTLTVEPRAVQLARGAAPTALAGQQFESPRPQSATEQSTSGAALTASRQGTPRGRATSAAAASPSSETPRPSKTTSAAEFGSLAQGEPGAQQNPIAAAGLDRPAGAAPTTQVTQPQRSGRTVLSSDVAAPGSGPVGTSGTAGAVGVAQLSRVARHESKPTEISGGGAVRPARRASTSEIPVDGAESSSATVAASSGEAGPAGSPLEPNIGGLQRQPVGPPGQMISLPAAGVVIAQAAAGDPSPAPMRSRATGSSQSPSGDAVGADRPATVARAERGIELHAPAQPTDEMAQAGIAGVSEQGQASAGDLPKLGQVVLGRTASGGPAAEFESPVGGETLAIGAAASVRLPGRVDSAANPNAVAAAASSARAGRSALVAQVDAKVDAPLGAAGASEGQLPTASRGPSDTAMPRPQSSEIQVARVASGGSSAATGLSGASRMPVDVTSELATSPAPAESSRRSRGDERSGSGSDAMARAMPQRVGRGLTPVRIVAATADALDSAEGRPSGAAASSRAESEGAVAGEMTVAKQSGSAATPSVAPPSAIAELLGESAVADAISSLRRAQSGSGAIVGAQSEARSARSAFLPEVSGAAAEVSVGPTDPPDAVAGPGVVPAVVAMPTRPAAAAGGVAVQIPAQVALGGLSDDASPSVGVPSRRARPESQVVHTIARRFVAERTSGLAMIDGAVNEPMESFRHRDVGQRGQKAQARGGSEGTERAVEMGLDFFARMQFPDGRWSLDRLPPDVSGDDPALGQMQSDSAATSLALLSFFGAGYTHLDDKHRDVVRRGLEWLVRNQKPNGDLFAGGTSYAWFYSHGMGAMALCEGYGMTQDPSLRAPAEKAVQFILDSQHPQRGGWRYSPRAESDTSVTGWQLQAIKSAQMAGLNVPADAFRRIDGWLDLAEAGGGRYVYNPFADRTRPEQAEGLRPSLAMTAEAMLMRMYLGRGRGDAGLAQGADWLYGNLPEMGNAQRPVRDCYYWYYGTQAMFHLQGEHWGRWNEKMRLAIEPTQVVGGPWAGSWHPEKPVRDRWGHAGGRIYVTAMHLLMLEVYYRVLPLYQELSK